MEKSYKVAIGVIAIVIIVALVIGVVFVVTSDKDDAKHVTLDKEGETYYIEDFGASKLHLDITADNVNVTARSYDIELEKLVVVLHGDCSARLKGLIAKTMDLRCDPAGGGRKDGALNVVNAIVSDTLTVSGGEHQVYLSYVTAEHIRISYDTLFFGECVYATDVSAVAHGGESSEFTLNTCLIDSVDVSGSESVVIVEVHLSTEGNGNGRFFRAEDTELLMISESYGIRGFSAMPADGIDAHPLHTVEISDEYIGLAVQLNAEGAYTDIRSDCDMPLHLDIENKKNAEVCAYPYGAEAAERGDANVCMRGGKLCVSGDDVVLDIFGGDAEYEVLSEKSTVNVLDDIESIVAENNATIVLDGATIGKLITKGEAKLEGSGEIVDYYYAKRPNIPSGIIVVNEHPQVG